MNDRLVIFDLDGTLYRTDLTIVEGVLRAADDVGLARPNNDRILSLGETAEDYVKRLFPDELEDVRRQFLERLRFHERTLIPKIGKLFDGTVELLDQLIDEGYTLAVCSNAGMTYIKLVLSTGGVLDRFTFLSGRESEKNKAERLRGLIEDSGAGFAVMVGDRVHDLDAARSCGIPCIGVTYGYAPNEAEEADLVAGDAVEVLSRIMRCEIFARIEKDLSTIESGSAKIVGVNGVDCSGKTIFASSLEQYLLKRGHKTQLIRLDDFHNPKEIRSRGDNEIDAYINNAFNLDLLADELLAPTKRGETIDHNLTLLDLDSDNFTNNKSYRIDPETIVIVEGVLLYRPPLDAHFDYRSFLDVTFAEVLRRAEARDVPLYGPEFLDRYRTKYIPIQKRYLAEHTPLKKCDLVVDNNDFRRPRVL
jgi:phosphoglycolate phosphatase